MQEINPDIPLITENVDELTLLVLTVSVGIKKVLLYSIFINSFAIFYLEKTL